MEDHESEWLGTPDAAKYLGITQRTLYRIIDAGDVTAYKMGRVLRIRRADLDDFLRRSRVQPGELRHLFPERVAERTAFERPEDGAPCPCGSGRLFLDCHGRTIASEP